MQLRLTHIVYPRNVRQINFGYQHVAVIPALYAYITELQQVPTPEEACRHLWPLREVDDKRKEETRERTIKLVLDFFRELHTFGLLAKHNAFGLVTYAGATDVDLGVDYTARMGMLKTAWMAPASSPVSYTHLRAHETVLDLVCRLLLEKKKTNNKNRNQEKQDCQTSN